MDSLFFYTAPISKHNICFNWSNGHGAGLCSGVGAPRSITHGVLALRSELECCFGGVFLPCDSSYVKCKSSRSLIDVNAVDWLCFCMDFGNICFNILDDMPYSRFKINRTL